MAEFDQDRPASTGVSQPPPPPPLPPQRPSVLQRFIAPLAFNRPAQREQGAHAAQSNSASPKNVSLSSRPYRHFAQRGATHKTGIPIAAIDVNESRTHAILVGKDILKTVKVHDQSMHEEFNIRGALNNYISTQTASAEEARKKREFLPAKDVRWSHHRYSHVVATAGYNGRIALYDVSRGSSRVELHLFYNHEGQVNKLDFDPHSGYMLLSGSQDKSCQIWDIREPKKPQGYAQFKVRAPVRDVRWSPTDAYQYAMCTEDGTVQKWDIKNPRQPVLSIRAHEKSCYTIGWHPDGRHLVSGGLDKNLKVWDLASDNRRQKPLFQLRCPAPIMNLAWRPACWSAEFAERGTWQTTQIATSYTDADPRIHIWDFRRPYLPFREISEYDTRPMDLLWADKDLLWSAGVAGVFVQNDIAFAPHPEDSLPPGDVSWSVDGSFYSVAQNRAARRRASNMDPAAFFLNVPEERLSGMDEERASRSFTDDEATDASFSDQIGTSQRASKGTSLSARASKSQANTPPTQDDLSKVLPLDRAVQAKNIFLVSRQVAAMSRIEKIYYSDERFKDLAAGFAAPSTAREREAEPDSILPNLELAFNQNATTCLHAGLLAQQKKWLLVADIVIPELKNWANYNRRQRLNVQATAAAKKAGKQKAPSSPPTQNTLSPFSKHDHGARDGKWLTKSGNVTSSLFRGLTDPKKGNSESDSHLGSNVTTPRQRSFANSPAVLKPGSTWFTLDDAVEPIPPLPPSLANTLSTAVTASRALRDNVSNLSDSPPSSPERLRSSPDIRKGHRRSATTSGNPTLNNTESNKSIQSPYSLIPVDQIRTPLSSRDQQDRRAALRDYRAPARQPLTLDAPHASPGRSTGDRHDSIDSLQMFSISTSSSARARSMGKSFDAPKDISEDKELEGDLGDSEAWVPKDSYYDSIGRSDNDGGPSKHSRSSQASYMPFGLDGASESKPMANGPVTNEFRNALGRRREEVGSSTVRTGQPESIGARGSEEILDDEVQGRGFFVKRRSLVNPMLRTEVGEIDRLTNQGGVDAEASLESGYLASDFRPIDLTRYEPAGVWLFSAFPVITELMERDSLAGEFACQFSAHLLSHLQPFFFHQSFASLPDVDDLNSWQSVTDHDRLLNPKFAARCIQNFFAMHIRYLEKRRLPIQAQILRKFAVEEAGFAILASPENFEIPASAPPGEFLKSDPHLLTASCRNCKKPVPLNATVCKSCKSKLQTCVVCEMALTTDPDATNSTKKTTGHALVAWCQKCGHTTHEKCMEGWTSLPDSNGECPSGCGCDCGPGLERTIRIERQIKQREDESAVRSSLSSAPVRDPNRARPSAAVNRARDSLATSSGGSSFGRRVRVVEPGEDQEDELVKIW